MAADEKFDIPDYELEKLARQLLPQIQKNLNSGNKNETIK